MSASLTSGWVISRLAMRLSLRDDSSFVADGVTSR